MVIIAYNRELHNHQKRLPLRNIHVSDNRSAKDILTCNEVFWTSFGRLLELPLLGGEGSEHDWNYLLHEMGVLYMAKEISAEIEKLSHMIVMISAASSWVLFIIGIFPKKHKHPKLFSV